MFHSLCVAIHSLWSASCGSATSLKKSTSEIRARTLLASKYSFTSSGPGDSLSLRRPFLVIGTFTHTLQYCKLSSALGYFLQGDQKIIDQVARQHINTRETQLNKQFVIRCKPLHLHNDRTLFVCISAISSM